MEECIRIPLKLKKYEEKFLYPYLEIDEFGFVSERIRKMLDKHPRYLREESAIMNFNDEALCFQYRGSKTGVITKTKDAIVDSAGVWYICISKFTFDTYIENNCGEKRQAHKVYATPHLAYVPAHRQKKRRMETIAITKMGNNFMEEGGNYAK